MYRYTTNPKRYNLPVHIPLTYTTPPNYRYNKKKGYTGFPGVTAGDSMELASELDECRSVPPRVAARALEAVAGGDFG